MSKFIKKLKEIKNETFHLSELNLSELVDEFDFLNKKDKEFIFGDYKDDKYINYNSDLHDLLKALEKSELDDEEKKLIIENYKQKYIENSFNRNYCLTFIDLFSKRFKTYDFKSLYKELFNNYTDDDLVYNYTIIFQEYDEGEYFIKSFKKYLDIKEKYGGFKYIDAGKITYLNKLDKVLFSEFILSLSSYNLLVFKKFKEEQVEDFIKKIEDINSPDINNHLKNILIGVVKALVKKENYSTNYDYLQLIREFIKSDFTDNLSIYLGKIFEDLSIELLDTIKELFYAYWEIIIIIGKIIIIKNIEKICKTAGNNYFDVYIYEQIEGGTRKDKNELLEEFKKQKGFNKKLKERQKQVKKVQDEDLKRREKEEEKINKVIQEIIDKENSKNPPEGINEWLLYNYEEKDKEFKEKEGVNDVVKIQVKRFFTLPASDPTDYELNYTEKLDTSSSYQTHQFVVNGTFLRCLKLYKEFGFEIDDNIRDKAIKYIPYTYTDELEVIFSIIGKDKLKNEEVEYILSIYDGSRIKDDLRFHNIQSFLYFYEKYKNNFLEYSKNELNDILFNIINNTEYRGYERFNATEKIVEIGEKKQLLELFTKYKGSKNYFNDTLVINEDDYNFKIAILSSKYLLKRFEKIENKIDIVNWYIAQLKTKINFQEPDFGRVRSISKLESEISWNIDEDNNFIYAFKYINDLNFEDDIKELLKYSFEIAEESENYKIYAKYIQEAVFYFYEGIKEKKLKNIFELEKYVNNLKIKNNEIIISFKVSILDKLIDLYSEKLKKSDISKVYKTVYKINKDKEKENKLLNEKLKVIEKEREKLEIDLYKIKEDKLKLESELNQYKDSEIDDSVILFVEGKTDKRYLEIAYKNLYSKDFPYKIEMLYGKLQVRNYIDDIELLNYTYSPEGKLFIALFDFDSSYSDFNGLQKLKTFSSNPNIKRSSRKSQYAFLLPTNNIHSDIKKNIYIDGLETNEHFKDKSEFEIEHLFYGFDSEIDGFFEDKDVVGGGKIKILKECEDKNDKKMRKHKIIFFQLIERKNNEGKIKGLFDNFIPIFELIDKIIEDSKNPTPMV